MSSRHGLYSPEQTARIIRHASTCGFLSCRQPGSDCATDGEMRGLLLEFDRQITLVRERVAAIIREAQRPGHEWHLNFGVIATMCEAILNPDFAAEIGVDPTPPALADGATPYDALAACSLCQFNQQFHVDGNTVGHKFSAKERCNRCGDSGIDPVPAPQHHPECDGSCSRGLCLIPTSQPCKECR